MIKECFRERHSLSAHQAAKPRGLVARWLFGFPERLIVKVLSVKMEPAIGVEPMTLRLRIARSTN